MANQIPWLKALQVSESQLSEWHSHANSKENFTFWCLANKKIDDNKYLAWAQAHYGLAILQSRFFKSEAKVQLWEQIKSVANWSPSMIPVHEWDGVVFVACVEPRHDIQWSFPVQYVLAHASDLEVYWKALHAAPVAPAPKVEAPAPTQNLPELPELPDAPDSPEGLSFNFDSEPAAATPASDAPEGMDAPAGFDAPEGFTLAVNPSDNTATKPALDMGDLVPDGFAAPLPPTPEATEETEPLKPIIQTATADTNVLKIPHHNEHTTEAALNEFSSDPSITRINVGAGDSALHEYFKQMTADFSGVMVMKLSEGNFVPFSWDQMWRPQGDAKGPTELTSPSAFRIVYRTKQPYLGHIVDTPVNRSFFEAWGESELPKQILIQPLLHNDKIMGAMICRCSDGHKNSQILLAGQKHAQKISELLKTPSAKAA